MRTVMRRGVSTVKLFALLSAVFTLLCAPLVPASAANVPCASIPITSLPSSPLVNANLQCDSVTGALVVQTGGGSATVNVPYSSGYGLTPIPQSFIGVSGSSALGGGNPAGEIDAWVFGPSVGPVGGLGLPLGTPGVPYMQGIGPYGTVPVALPAQIYVLGSTAPATLSPTVTASAYTAGYVVGGLLNFTNVFPSDNSGTLNSISVSFNDVQTSQFLLYVFSANPTASTFTDHAAPVIALADRPKLLGVYQLAASNSGLGTNTIYNRDAIGKQITSTTAGIYAVLVTISTITPASTSDLTISLGVTGG